MKKNNSKKLILAAVLFFSGGLILPLGNQEIVSAAQEEQGEKESESLFQQEKSEVLEEKIEAAEEAGKGEGSDSEEKDEEVEENEEEKEDEIEGEKGEEKEEEVEEENGEEKEDEIEGEDGETEKEEENNGEEENEKIEKEEKGESEERIEEEVGKKEENKDENAEIEGQESYDGEKNELEGKEESDNGGDKKEDTENDGTKEVPETKKEEIEKEVWEENQCDENVEKEGIKEEVGEDITENIVNESCNGNSEGKNRMDTEVLGEHYMESDEIPEGVIVQQIILSPEKLEQSSVGVEEQTTKTECIIKQESQTSDSEVTVKESPEMVEQAKENLVSSREDEKEALEDLKVPVMTIEKLVTSPEKKEVRFYYRMDDENLVEHQIKVFFCSGGKEELIWQEDNKTEGELSFETEGNYLVYLYAKDSSGNESRIYQNYSLGSFELNLEELNQFENQEVELEDIDVLLEDVFEGSNVATYQLYINGEPYKGDSSQIPEGKCILTVEMEDTHGNSGQKTMEIIAANNKTKVKTTEEEIEERGNVPGVEEIQYKDNIINEEAEEFEVDEKNENGKKDSGIPYGAAGILGSLISGLLILFRRIKH